MFNEFRAQCRYAHVAVPLDHYIIVFGGKWRDNQPFNIHTIWMYNLYTEQWETHFISEDEMSAEWGKYCLPQTRGQYVTSAISSACAVPIGGDVFLFGGIGRAVQFNYTTGKQQQYEYASNALAKLSRTRQGTLSWSYIKHQSKMKSPSPRCYHTGWEYAEKLWIFGGNGSLGDGFLNDNGDFTQADANNQLMCFNPSCGEWTNPECTGNIPEPRTGHSSAILRDTLWLFGETNEIIFPQRFDDLYQLNMYSLIFTKMDAKDPKPSGSTLESLTVISDRQLLLYGTFKADDGKSVIGKWIFDQISGLWRKHEAAPSEKHYRLGHTGTIIIITRKLHLQANVTKKVIILRNPSYRL